MQTIESVQEPTGIINNPFIQAHIAASLDCYNPACVETMS